MAAKAGTVSTAAQVEIELQRLRRKSASDRALLSQAERERQAAGEELAAARQEAEQLARDNAELQANLTAMQRQLRHLELARELGSAFEQGEEEEQQRQPVREEEQGTDAAHVRTLEWRCAALEAELGQAAAALHTAQSPAAKAGSEGPQASPQRRGRSQQQQRQRQERAASLTLSDLCDLDGLASQLDGAAVTNPQHAMSQRSGSIAKSSRQRALHQHQHQQEGETEQQDEAGVANYEGEAGMPPSLQHQVQEQQLRLDMLQAQLLQQQEHQGPGSQAGSEVEEEEEEDQAWHQARHLQSEVDRLKQHNTQLQAAVAEASLHAPQAAQKQLAAAQEEMARLRRQLEQSEGKLAGLRGAAAAFAAFAAAAEDGSGEEVVGSSMQLQKSRAELLEYAERCNAALEQNTGLLQEKRQWLDKLKAAEAEVERCRGQAQALRLQLVQLLPDDSASATAHLHYQHQEQREDGEQGQEPQWHAAKQLLVKQLLDGQAAEAALAGVLAEAREEQLAACKALAAELRRVQSLERLRMSDVAEQRRLQCRVHDLQRECLQLAQSLVAAQQQEQEQGGVEQWPIKQMAADADFRIAAFHIAAPEEALMQQSHEAAACK